MIPAASFALTDRHLAAETAWLAEGYVPDMAAAVDRFEPRDAADGDVVLFHALDDIDEEPTALRALDLYTWGDTRESRAGREWLEHRLAAI